VISELNNIETTEVSENGEVSGLNNIEPLIVSDNFSSKKTEKSESEEVNVPICDCVIENYNL
jgi:hypothetical protein